MGDAPKRKRGRPTINELTDGVVKDIANLDANQKTTRTYINQYYTAAGFNFIGEHREEIQNADLIVEKVPLGLDLKAAAVSEQIGRMLEQDYQSEEETLATAQIAAAMLKAGYTVKQTASWIRKCRTEGFEKPEIMEAATEIHLTYEEIAIASNCFEILRDLLAAYMVDRTQGKTTELTQYVEKHNLDTIAAIRELLNLEHKFNAKLD